MQCPKEADFGRPDIQCHVMVEYALWGIYTKSLGGMGWTGRLDMMYSRENQH